jgi:hypothetical protein
MTRGDDSADVITIVHSWVLPIVSVIAMCHSCVGLGVIVHSCIEPIVVIVVGHSCVWRIVVIGVVGVVVVVVIVGRFVVRVVVRMIRGVIIVGSFLVVKIGRIIGIMTSGIVVISRRGLVVVGIIGIGLVVAIEKDKTGIGLLTPGKKQHPVLDLVGHGKRCGVEAVNDTAAVETEEIEAPLSVPRGTEGKSANGTWSHSIVMWFMRLNILTELVLAVTIMVNSLTRHNSAWTERDRYAVCGGKGI